MTLRHFAVALSALACGLLATNASRATITPAPLFSDNAVLQRNVADPVWGTAEPGEIVTVAINGQTMHATVDSSGSWSGKLPAMKEGGPYEMTIQGTKSDPIKMSNVFIGEVWLCTGQSNMFWPLHVVAGGADAVANSTDPELHLAMVDYAMSPKPQTSAKIRWSVAGPSTSPNYSAVAYYFGRSLRQTLKVPIGLVESCCGATNIETWISGAPFNSDPVLRPYLNTLPDYEAKYPGYMERYRAAKAAFDARVDAAKAAGTAIPTDRPGEPIAPDKWNNVPSVCFNGMINPLIPYGIRGAIWYQGESNGWRGFEYRKLFPTLINDWRTLWGIGDFPFIYVQLPGYKPGGPSWAELREAQRETLVLPNTGMAVIHDVGAQNVLHPLRKQVVGERLALIASSLVYHRPGEYYGPVFQGINVQNGKVLVKFTHAEGLHASEMRDETDDGPILASASQLVGFEVAGNDRKFYPADAKIDGSMVVVSSDQVPSPVAVRYGWAGVPVANLVNGANLWASPFKSDDWPWLSDRK